MKDNLGFDVSTYAGGESVSGMERYNCDAWEFFFFFFFAQLSSLITPHT